MTDQTPTPRPAMTAERLAELEEKLKHVHNICADTHPTDSRHSLNDTIDAIAAVVSGEHKRCNCGKFADVRLEVGDDEPVECCSSCYVQVITKQLESSWAEVQRLTADLALVRGDGVEVERVPHGDGAVTYEVAGCVHVLRSPDWGMDEPLIQEQAADPARLPELAASIRAAQSDLKGNHDV